MEKVAIYVRVSTKEQAEEGYSIDEQLERLRKYCDARDWKVANEYVDAGYSGSNIERPAMQNLIHDIEKKKIDMVLVYKLDRLSRSQKDTLFLIEDVFLANGCDFVSMNENFDTSSPFGRAMIGILAVFSQLEREQIKERMTMGLEARAKEGKFHGSAVAPIGYDYVDGELVINQFERLQIERIYDMYLRGYSPNQIAEELNSIGMHHKYGKWNRTVVKRALERKTYLGLIEHKGKTYQGLHEPIISQDTFDAVQRAIKDRASAFTDAQQGKHISSYLGGLLYCAQCGAKYGKYTKYQHNKASGRTYVYYICNSKHKRTSYLIKDPNCKNKTWNMNALDELVFDEIRKLSIDPEYLKTIKGTKATDNRPKIIDKKIDELDNQLSKLLELYSMDGMDYEVLQDKINELNTNKLLLSMEKTKILKEQENALSRDDAIKLLGSFEHVLETGTFEEIRAIITALIEKIVIDGEDITIFWKFK